MAKEGNKKNSNSETSKAVVRKDEGSFLGFLVATFLYVVTGILQPIVIDYLKSHGALGRKILVLPTLANVMGMACCGVMVESKAWSSLYQHRRLILTASAVDWVSGMLLTGGILLTGGAIFVIFYNSCPVWTALLSYFVMKQSLTLPQTAGIILVSCGLIFNVLGNRSTASTTNASQVKGNTKIVMIGSIIVLLGSFMHSCMFVISELALKNKSTKKNKSGKNNNKNENANGKNDINSIDISPPLWSSALGILETFAMMMWVMINVHAGGFFDPELGIENPTTPFVLQGFIALLCVDAIHAASFFSLLSKLGAVASALLKGVQTIIVVLLSAAFFCDADKAPQQCLDRVKISSMSIVLVGVLCFAGSKKKKDTVKVLKKPRSSKAKSSPPTSETESFLKK